MKTRIIRGLAATAAILLIICMGVTAASAQSVSVNPTTTTDLCPDYQFTVTVEVDSGADDLRAVSLDLTYDSTVFEVLSDTVEYDLFGAGNYLDIGTGDDGAGTINVQIARKGTVHEPESGTLLTVVFEVKTGAADATYDLSLHNVVLKDENNNAISGVTETDGTAEVDCGGTTPVPTVSVSPETTTDLCPDDQFTVTVEVDSGADDLRAVSLDLTYDSTVFEVLSDTVEYDLFGAGNYLDIGTGDDGAGTINVQIARKGTVHEPESGTLLTVVFEVKTGAADATYDLSLHNVVLKDENNNAISGVTETDGTAEVDCGGTTPVPTVNVSPETTTDLCPDTNDEFTVTVEVDSGADDLRAVSLDLTYDSTVFEVLSDTVEYDLFGAGNYLDIGTGDDGAGTINVQIARKGTVHEPESGTLLTVVFEVKTGAADATYDLSLHNVVLKDENNNAISGVTETDGTAEVNCNDDPTVTVTYPVGGTVSGTIGVTATATDTDGTVTQVAFYLMPAGTLIGTDTNAAGGWSVPLDTTTAADGIGYRIKAVATDNEGATGDDTGSVFAIDNSCQCDFCLDLEAGLNFVSIPKTINGSNDAKTVFDVDYYSGEFCLYYDTSAGSFDTNADVKPCRGFLVYKKAAKTVCVDFDDTASAPSQQLYEGWNMIGHIKTVAMPINDGTTADFVSITGLEEPEGNELFRLMATYTPGTGWAEYPSGSITDATPGAGYWIYMDQDRMMSGGFE